MKIQPKTCRKIRRFLFRGFEVSGVGVRVSGGENSRCLGRREKGVEMDITGYLFRTAQILDRFDKRLYIQGLTALIEHRAARQSVNNI